MSKVLKTAAIVVGAVALAATGVGALGTAGIIGSTVLGVSTATIAAAGTIASIAGAALSVGAALTAPKPNSRVSGSQTVFTASPDDGLPLIIGRRCAIGAVAWGASP